MLLLLGAGLMAQEMQAENTRLFWCLLSLPPPAKTLFSIRELAPPVPPCPCPPPVLQGYVSYS